MGALGDVFAGQVIVVTGGGGGIGRALCIGFAADGATVVAVGHRAHTLAATAELCSRAITCIRADLSLPDECFRAVEETLAAHGRIDVLVNNAGLGASGSFLEQPFQQWADTIALNLVGVAACCRAALPHMIRQAHGRIVSMASRMAGAKIRGASAYSASKLAVSALTRCIAAELANLHPDVLINELIPGPTKTGMSRSGQEPADVYPHVRNLVLLPAGGPSGQIFFRDAPYRVLGGFVP
ncbi:MAG: SDR family NAD(P)-dependent oxidoreductase [Steroidobacteraceae bacterium]